MVAELVSAHRAFSYIEFHLPFYFPPPFFGRSLRPAFFYLAGRSRRSTNISLHLRFMTPDVSENLQILAPLCSLGSTVCRKLGFQILNVLLYFLRLAFKRRQLFATRGCSHYILTRAEFLYSGRGR